jgi:hypothetical protein
VVAGFVSTERIPFLKLPFGNLSLGYGNAIVGKGCLLFRQITDVTSKSALR